MGEVGVDGEGGPYGNIVKFLDLFIQLAELATIRGAGKKCEVTIAKCGLVLTRACEAKINEAIEWRRKQPIVFDDGDEEGEGVDVASVSFLGNLFNKVGETISVVVDITNMLDKNAKEEKSKRMNTALFTLKNNLERFLKNFLTNVVESYGLQPVELIGLDEWGERKEIEEEMERGRKKEERKRARELENVNVKGKDKMKKRRIVLLNNNTNNKKEEGREESEEEDNNWENEEFADDEEDEDEDEDEEEGKIVEELSDSEDGFGVVGDW